MQCSRGNASILSSRPDDRLLFRFVSTSEEVGHVLVHRPISPCEGIVGGSVIAGWVARGLEPKPLPGRFPVGAARVYRSGPLRCPGWVALLQLPKRSGVGFPVGSLPSCQPKPAVLPRSRGGSLCSNCRSGRGSASRWALRGSTEVGRCVARGATSWLSVLLGGWSASRLRLRFRGGSPSIRSGRSRAWYRKATGCQGPLFASAGGRPRVGGAGDFHHCLVG
jgi:hypothetical protein